MINSLLSSGEVPGLYSPEELEPLITVLRQNASNEGFSGNLISYFAKSVKKNLHVILITDVTHPDFVQNCESNPALYKECQVSQVEQYRINYAFPIKNLKFLSTVKKVICMMSSSG